MEPDSGVLAVVAFGVVAVLVLAWLIVRNPPHSADQAQALLLEASETARVMVMAAEQLWRTGRLPADKRFDWVANQLRDQYNLDPQQVAALIEAGVYWVKHLAAAQASPSRQPLGAQGLPVRGETA